MLDRREHSSSLAFSLWTKALCLLSLSLLPFLIFVECLRPLQYLMLWIGTDSSSLGLLISEFFSFLDWFERTLIEVVGLLVEKIPFA